MKKVILSSIFAALASSACGGGNSSEAVSAVNKSNTWTGSTVQLAGTISLPYMERSHYNLITVGDLNNDGYDDIVLGPLTFSTNFYKIIVGFYNPDTENFEVNEELQSRMPTMQWASHGVISDFNKDGYSDVFMTGTGPDNGVCGEASVLLLGSPTGLNDASHLMPRASGYAHQMAADDFDNDGYTDMFILNNNWGSSSDTKCSYRKYQYTDKQYLISSKTWSSTTPSVTYNGIKVMNPSSSGWGSAASADFDGDGNKDLVVWSFNDGITLMKGSGTGQFSVRTVLKHNPYAPSPTVIAGMSAKDLDGDGRPELLVSAVKDPQIQATPFQGNTITVFKFNNATSKFTDVTSTFIKNNVATSAEQSLIWCQEFKWIDLNDDGKEDMVCSIFSEFVYSDLSQNATRVWLRTSAGFEPANITANVIGKLGNAMPAILKDKKVIVGISKKSGPNLAVHILK